MPQNPLAKVKLSIGTHVKIYAGLSGDSQRLNGKIMRILTAGTHAEGNGFGAIHYYTFDTINPGGVWSDEVELIDLTDLEKVIYG